MARYNSKTDSKTAKAEDQKSTISTEGTAMDADIFDDEFPEDAAEVTEDAPETEDAVVSDDASAPTEDSKEPEAEPDISNFVALVESLIERDETGEVTEVTDEGIVSVQNAYKALSRKEKNLAKNDLSSKMEKAVMEDDDISLAKFYLEVNNRMTEVVKVKREPKEKKVVDPSEAYVKLVAKLDLARALVQIPENLDKADIEKRAGELFATGAADAQKDEPELVWVKQALNLAQPKSAKVASTGGTRTRHSVANHIAEAFANAEPGESLTVSQIADFKSEEYGDDRPSKQAIMAHLSSKKFRAATALTVEEDEKGEPVLTKK